MADNQMNAMVLLALFAIAPFANVPSIHLTCANQSLNISSDASKWDEAFIEASAVQLTTTPGDPRLKDYKYTGSSGYAVVRITCDPNKLYFLGEYVIPGNSTTVNYKPSDFVVYVDALGDRTPTLQKDDYKFDVVARQQYKGVWYSNGAAYSSQGQVTWTPWSRIETISDGNKWLTGSDSIVSSSVFQQPHPAFYLDMLKSFQNANFTIQNPFGLAFFISDQNVVSNSDGGMYYFAIFPNNNLGFDYRPNILYNPMVWADAYYSLPTQTQPSTSTIAVESYAVVLGVILVVVSATLGYYKFIKGKSR